MNKLRLWMTFNPGLAGLVPVLGVAIIVIAMSIHALWPTGHAEQATGRIVSLGALASDEGATTMATINLASHIITLALPPGLDCRVGDDVKLVRAGIRAGYVLHIAISPKACQRHPVTVSTGGE